jgi:RND family efflux transporter MFP subunit
LRRLTGRTALYGTWLGTWISFVNLRPLSLLRPAAILAFAGAVAMFMISTREELRARDVDAPVPLVEVLTVSRGPVPVTVTAHGNVRAARQLTLAAQVSGRILWKSERFEPGVIVGDGEPLLRIDDTDYRLALAEARQALASAELSLADARALRQAARVDEAEAAVAAAQARIARAERDLANTEVTAPYAAIIDTQLVELGQFISVGTQLGRVLGTDRAEVRLPITQQDIGFIDPELQRPVVLSTTVGGDTLAWEGTLRRIEGRVDDQTRVFPVIVSVAEPQNLALHRQPLPFGLFVKAEIPGREMMDAALIPQASLHGDSDVFLFENGALTRRTVHVARLADGKVLVTDGLADGDRVVTTRLDLMYEGMQVALLDD